MARQPGEEKILGKKSKKTIQMGLALEKPNDEQEKKIINNNQKLKAVKNGGDMAGLNKKDLDDALKNALSQFASSPEFKIGVQDATNHLVTEEKLRNIVGAEIQKLPTEDKVKNIVNDSKKYFLPLYIAAIGVIIGAMYYFTSKIDSKMDSVNANYIEMVKSSTANKTEIDVIKSRIK